MTLDQIEQLGDIYYRTNVAGQDNFLAGYMSGQNGGNINFAGETQTDNTPASDFGTRQYNYKNYSNALGTPTGQDIQGNPIYVNNDGLYVYEDSSVVPDNMLPESGGGNENSFVETLSNIRDKAAQRFNTPREEGGFVSPSEVPELLSSVLNKVNTFRDTTGQEETQTNNTTQSSYTVNDITSGLISKFGSIQQAKQFLQDSTNDRNFVNSFESSYGYPIDEIMNELNRLQE
jgi:hypothetical protein